MIKLVQRGIVVGLSSVNTIFIIQNMSGGPSWFTTSAILVNIDFFDRGSSQVCWLGEVSRPAEANYQRRRSSIHQNSERT